MSDFYLSQKRAMSIGDKMEDTRNQEQAPVKSSPTPNDQKSAVFNPASPAFKGASDNRSNQMNPNNAAYHSSRAGNRGKR
jgi:hypothetical protein